MKYSRAVQPSGKKMDMALLIAVIAACLIGLCAIFSATRSYESNTNVIVQGGVSYRVRSSRAYWLGDAVHHWWALLEREREAAR